MKHNTTCEAREILHQFGLKSNQTKETQDTSNLMPIKMGWGLPARELPKPSYLGSNFHFNLAATG